VCTNVLRLLIAQVDVVAARFGEFTVRSVNLVLVLVGTGSISYLYSCDDVRFSSVNLYFVLVSSGWISYLFNCD
jgi:hypothetical protein